MEHDRIGIQIDADTDSISGILTTMEITDEVVDECVENNLNTIITFHPLIFHKLSEIVPSERIGRLCSKLIKNNINVISVHTTFDAHPHGTSRILAELLNLNFVSTLVPDANIQHCGMGVIANAANPIDLKTLAQMLNSVCAANVQYCCGKSQFAQRIAIVGGSGSDFIDYAIVQDCDAFITADVSYHQFHSANGHIALFNVGHYEMEQFVGAAINNLLTLELDKANIKHTHSKVITNPVRSFPNDYTQLQQNILNNIII
jgi:dinuclear metal center YbgI/SA1388 family protein